MNNLPRPPVPQKLREMLKDYPQYLDELQRTLNELFAKPLHGTPLFEQAIWGLEAALESFVSDARDDLDKAKAIGALEAVRSAEEKLRLMRHGATRMWRRRCSLPSRLGSPMQARSIGC
ncbi:hypothetical protein [Xanthomonas graminis]|uniref:hypothetical protein n=1 Tax=Xanthomonas graminis TaxID=3390026 RepID=UPI00118741CA|nr:hypothetical protein [Xanthomonas translucens]UKE76934.1 hypothetical protein KM317_16070 [Xanthomonas translucens pv. arrhenatheri]